MIAWILGHLNWSVIILGVLFTVGLFLYYFNVNESKSVLSYVPNIWTSLGILGTFVSIVNSLKGMDFTGAETINVGLLVDGIIPAFETSIIGIIGAILTSIGIKMIFAESDSTEDYRASQKENEIIRYVKEISNKEENIHKSLNNIITKVAEGILTEVDTILASKLEELIKSHTTDVNKILQDEKLALELYCKSATSAFEAQTKKMEEAVGKMETSCTEKLGDLSKSFSVGCQTISSDSVKSINTLKEEVINSLSTGIGKQTTDILQTLDAKNRDFLKETEMLNGELVKKVKEGILAIGKQADDILGKMTKQNKEVLEEIDKMNEEFCKKAKDGGETIVRTIGEETKAVVDSFTSVAQSERQKLDETLLLYETISTAVNAASASVEGKINGAVNDTITALKTELAGSLQSLRQISSELIHLSGQMKSSSIQYDKAVDTLKTLLTEITEAENKLNEFLNKFVGIGAEVQEIYKKLENITEMNYALNFRIEELRKGYRTTDGTASTPIVCPHCHAEITNPMANFCPKCGKNLNDVQEEKK